MFIYRRLYNSSKRSLLSYVILHRQNSRVGPKFRILDISLVPIYVLTACKHISRHMTDLLTVLLSLQQLYFSGSKGGI
jgi:hypothetical protein